MGRPRKSQVQKLYVVLHRQLFTILNNMRYYNNSRGSYIKLYYANTNLSSLKNTCERIVNLVDSIELARYSKDKLLSKEERLKYLRKKGAQDGKQ